MAMKRLPQVSAMAMMLALAACGNGGDGSGGGGGTTPPGGGQTPGGSIPGATFSSDSGVASLSAESVTVNGTTYDNVTEDGDGVRTYTASTSGGTAAVVEQDMVMASKVGEETLGATLNSGVYGAYATGLDAELGSTSMGFYGGVNTTDVPETGGATYEGGALGIETVTDGDGNETLNSYTGSMSATVDFTGAADNTVSLDYDEFGTISSTGGTFNDEGLLSGETITVDAGDDGAAGTNYDGDGATSSLSAQLVGEAGAEMVGDVSLASAPATEGDSYEFSGGFGGTGTATDGGGGDGDGGGDTLALGNAVPTGVEEDIPFGGDDATDRPDLNTLTVTYDAGGTITTVDLDPTSLDDDNLIVYTDPDTTLGSGTVADIDVAYATRVGEESLDQTLSFTSFGVWSADVTTGTDVNGDPETNRRFGSFFDGTPPGADISALSGTASYTGAAIGIENAAGTETLRTGEMTADVDFDASTLDTTLNFTNDGGPGFTFGGLELSGDGSFDTVAGTTLNDQDGNALVAPYDPAEITIARSGSFAAGSLTGGDGTATPGEIGGVFRVLTDVNDIAGSFGGAVDTAP